MLFKILDITTITNIIPIDFIASPTWLNNKFKICCPIVWLSISPFIAPVISSPTSKSNSSLLYLSASSIKPDIPSVSDWLSKIASVSTSVVFVSYALAVGVKIVMSIIIINIIFFILSPILWQNFYYCF